jgi:hypothetical protein
MGGEILVLGIIGLLTWLIPFFGLPIPIIGLVWGILILRKNPQRVWLTRIGVILCGLGLGLSAFYTTIDALGSTPDIIDNDFPSDFEYQPPDDVEPGSIEWRADGEITDGEYLYQKSVGSSIVLYWNSDGEYVEIGMKVATTGWVALGIQPDPRDYSNVDTILGYADRNSGEIFDLWNPTAIENFRARDIALDGTNDILEFGASEGFDPEEVVDDDEDRVTYTIIEFKRAYDTGDIYDLPLYSGDNDIFCAFGSDEDRESTPVEKERTYLPLE